MNTTTQSPFQCTCSNCPGAGCTCGCQQPSTQAACACGTQCQCGPQCACAQR